MVADKPSPEQPGLRDRKGDDQLQQGARPIFRHAFDPDKGSQPSIADYQTWADHIRGYTASITDPELAPHARRLADEAQQFVAFMAQVRNNTNENEDPLAPPPWVHTYVDMNRQFNAELVHSIKPAVPRRQHQCSRREGPPGSLPPESLSGVSAHSGSGVGARFRGSSSDNPRRWGPTVTDDHHDDVYARR